MLKLRPHHLNCIFFFEGKGYSKKFVKHMTEIVKSLQENTKQEIELVKGLDDICACCPNRQEERCISTQKVEKLDEGTLSKYGLEIGNSYSFDQIISKIYKDFKVEQFEAICKSCEWYQQGVCSVLKIAKQGEAWK